MRIVITILFFLIILSDYLVAQDDKDFHPPNFDAPKADNAADKPKAPDELKKGFSWDKVYTGGNFGLQFGTLTIVELSPLIGYNITKKWSAGIGGTFLYANGILYDAYGNTIPINQSIYGGRAFTRFAIIDNLFIHGEYELINLKALVWDPSTSSLAEQRLNVPGLYLGVGYRQMLGQRSSWNILILYNFLQTYYSPYSNPVIRMGFNFGL